MLPTNRIRRYLPPLLMLLPVIFICGKLLLTPVQGVDPISGDEPFEYGWPWKFGRIRNKYNALTQPFSTVGKLELYGWRLAADLAVLIVAVVVCGLLFSGWWRRCNYRLRFSLRSCLLFMIVPASVLGWWISHVRGWRDEQPYLAPNGITTYSYEYTGFEWQRRFFSKGQLEVFSRAQRMGIWRNEELTPQEAATALAAIPQLNYLNAIALEAAVATTDAEGKARRSPIITPASVPDPSIFHRIESVRCQCQNDEFMGSFTTLGDGEYYDYATDETLKVLGKLGKLKALDLCGCDITDAGLFHLQVCRALEQINLAKTKITDEGLKWLPLRQLRELSLAYCQIDDVGLAHLADCHNLEYLDLSYTQITTVGLFHLAELRKLKKLNLQSTEITDDAIKLIVKLRSLEDLDLSNCEAITENNLPLLLDMPNLCEVGLLGLPEVSDAMRKRVGDTVWPRWCKRMEAD